nr:hypothetical protein [Tanacetum cinerariifolium]
DHYIKPTEFRDSRDDIDKDENHILGPSTEAIAKKFKELIEKDELLIADLEGAGLEWLKVQYNNDVELEYHVSQLKATVLSEAQWNIDEGDVSKPRSFERHMSKSTKPHPCFYNNDYTYIVYLTTEEKYTTSITKNYATRYYKEGIEDRIPGRWSKEVHRYHFEALNDLRIKSVVRIDVKKKWGYGFLTSIIVWRSDDKDNEFSYADLPRLSVNDVEDIRTVTKNIVDDIQLGMESYQRTLNLTKPIMFFEGINQWIPFIMTATHKGIVYINQYNIKSLMKLSEVKKFRDGTLVKSSRDMLKKIDEILRHRDQLRRLEEYVGGRPGSESRPPMLNKENYVPWSSRLLRYAKRRPNGKLIHNSILNGPYVRKMIPEPGDANREITITETFHLQTDDELSDKELKQIEADDQAIQTILLGLPEDIYAAVDSCEIAQEIWLRVQQMMKGSDIVIQEKKAKFFNEWEMFTSNKGESIESYYHRFLKLMNDLKRNKHFPEKIASNLKFLNNLQPEWSRHVTIVHQTKDLHTADYTQLYDFLKYNQKEVDKLKAERIAKTQDPLALMANSNNPCVFPAPHQDQPSFNLNYLQQPMTNPKDITDSTNVMNMALALMAKVFKLNYSTPTNNNQRISSNPKNRQIAQPGNPAGYNDVIENQVNQNDVQNPRIQNVGNQNGLIGVQGNGNLVAARADGNAARQNRNQIRCYNCRGIVDLDEIKKVNANCILMANLQKASTSGTQTDNAPVYDTDGLAENPTGQSHLRIFLSKEIFEGGMVRIHNAFVHDKDCTNSKVASIAHELKGHIPVRGNQDGSFS